MMVLVEAGAWRRVPAPSLPIPALEAIQSNPSNFFSLYPKNAKITHRMKNLRITSALKWMIKFPSTILLFSGANFYALVG